MASIIKKLNKQTGITYVYESESYWDKEKKQPRSKRRLIGRGNRNKKEMSGIQENISDPRELEALRIKQAGQIQRDEAEISALKKQVMELTLSVNEYKRRLSKIEELSRL